MQETVTGLAVEAWPIERVRPYEGNPRIIPETAIKKVAAAIKEFGWRQPLVVDREGVLVVGHARLLAATRLGLAHVPVHVAADLTPEQARAYRLADNRTGEESRWNPDALNFELRELGAVGFDLKLAGFDPVELPGEPPQFETISFDAVKPLDEKKAVACPNCGHRFQPS